MGDSGSRDLESGSWECTTVGVFLSHGFFASGVSRNPFHHSGPRVGLGVVLIFLATRGEFGSGVERILLTGATVGLCGDRLTGVTAGLCGDRLLL